MAQNSHVTLFATVHVHMFVVVIYIDLHAMLMHPDNVYIDTAQKVHTL